MPEERPNSATILRLRVRTRSNYFGNCDPRLLLHDISIRGSVDSAGKVGVIEQPGRSQVYSLAQEKPLLSDFESGSIAYQCRQELQLRMPRRNVGK